MEADGDEEGTPCSYLFDYCQGNTDCRFHLTPCSEMQYHFMASACCGEVATDKGSTVRMTTDKMTMTTTITTTTTAGPTTTTTTSSKYETTERIRTVLTLQALDFDKVNSNAAVKAELITNIKKSFLEKLPQGYTEQHLSVTLSKGSVKAQVDITPISAVSSQTLQAAMVATSPEIESRTLEKVKAMPAVESMLESGKQISDLSVVVKQPPEDENKISASASFSLYARASFAPLLSLWVFTVL